MENSNILQNKKILIVDDEPDILETVKEILNACDVDTATKFEAGAELLDRNHYDVVILDIMGVRGYELLDICIDKGIPALMLTAHALSPDHLRKSVEKGALAYIPKEKITDIAIYIKDILKKGKMGIGKPGSWFAMLRPFFHRKFGPDWRESVEFLFDVKRIDLILVPTDFSPLSCEAFPWAAFLAKKLNAGVLILHVFTERDAQKTVLKPGNPWERVLEQEDQQMVEDFRACLVGDFGKEVAIETMVAVGSPQEKILEVAEDREVGLIVMSIQGRTGLPSALVGSVAEYVMRNASCPVLSVKPKGMY